MLSRNKLKLYSILLIILISATLALISYITRKEYVGRLMQDDIEYLIEITSSQLKSKIELRIDNLITRNTDFSSDGYIRELVEGLVIENEDVKTDLLTHLQKNKAEIDKSIFSIVITDLDGNIVISSYEDLLLTNLKNTDYFDQTYFLNYGEARFFESNNNIFANTDQNRFFVTSAPLKTVENRSDLAVITIFWKNDIFNNAFESFKSDFNNRISVESIIFSKNSNSLVYSNKTSREEFQIRDICQQKFFSIDLISSSNSNNIYQSTRCTELIDWLIISRFDNTLNYREEEQNVLLLSLAIFIVVVISGLSFFIFMYFKIFRPLEFLNLYAEQVKTNNFNISYRSIGNDEISRLVNSFNLLLIKIKSLYFTSKSEIKVKTQELQDSLEELERKNNVLKDSQQALISLYEEIETEKEKAISFSEDLKKFKMAVDNSFDGILITDEKVNIVYANEALSKLTGFSNAEIIGNKPENLWGGHMDESFYKNMWKTIKTEKKPFRKEFLNLKKDGTQYVGDLFITPLLDRNKNIIFFVAIQRDVTKAREIDKMKNEFISIASHQLKTPLTTSKWYIELLNESSNKLSKVQKEYVEYLDDSNKRMIELVNALLNVSRIESGRIIIDPIPTDLSKLIKTTIKDLKALANNKNIQIKLSIKTDLPLVKIDPKLISQVISNLVSNSIKYSPFNSEVEISITKNKTHAVIEIKDYGYGIPKKDQPKIFNKFFRASNIVKSDTNGNGLGLYLVKAIIISSGGKISFKSVENKGTEFVIYLPLKGSKSKKGDVSLS